jgi:hypothetical protein
VRAAPMTTLVHGQVASAAAPWPLHKTNLSSGERKREERKRGDKKERRKKDVKVVAEKKERTGQKIRTLHAAVIRIFDYPTLTSKFSARVPQFWVSAGYISRYQK